MRLPVNRHLALAAPLMLAACASAGASPNSAAEGPLAGPGADYPVVIGDPFTIDGTTWTPTDVMNYDEVGYAIPGEGAGALVTGSSKTLPLPSYVEVTQLETGRTVLVRVDQRGPMRNDALIALSPAAATQLGLAGLPRSPVRVRRVNPPEAERAMLRTGEPVPARMDTPPSLLAALKRKLNGDKALQSMPAAPSPDTIKAAAVASAASAGAAMSAPASPDPTKATTHAPHPKPARASAPVQPAKPPVAAGKGDFVQVGAFSSEANARKAADQVGGTATPSGKLWLVRTGPHANKAETQAALAKARAAGYADALVRRSN